MPNWVVNRIVVHGTTKQIKDFKDKYHIEDDRFDFNNVIPQPKTIEECPEQYIIKGDEHIQILEDRPWFNWYEWNYAHWSVKWNASNVLTSILPSKIEIVFDTPWGSPYLVIDELMKKNPDLDIHFHRRYE